MKDEDLTLEYTKLERYEIKENSVILASPTCGKTYFNVWATSRGYNVIDTDWLMFNPQAGPAITRSAVNLIGKPSRGSTVAFDLFRAYSQMVKALVIEHYRDHKCILISNFCDNDWINTLKKYCDNITFFYRTPIDTTYQLKRRGDRINIKVLNNWFNHWKSISCIRSKILMRDQYVLDYFTDYSALDDLQVRKVDAQLARRTLKLLNVN